MPQHKIHVAGKRNGLAWLWRTQTLAVTITACRLLELLCLAATARSSPSFVCNAQAQSFQICIQICGCFALRRRVHSLPRAYHTSEPVCTPEVHASQWGRTKVISAWPWRETPFGKDKGLTVVSLSLVPSTWAGKLARQSFSQSAKQVVQWYSQILLYADPHAKPHKCRSKSVAATEQSLCIWTFHGQFLVFQFCSAVH